MSTINDAAVAAQADQQKHMKQNGALTKFASQYPRDMMMYTSTDQLKNIQLENTKIERAADCIRQKHLRNFNYL